MAKTTVPTAASRVLFAHARTDITPPVGIYHGFWGAARHDRATAVHRPLFGDVVAFGAVGDNAPRLVWALLDWTVLPPGFREDLPRAMSLAAAVPLGRTVISCSHTHASGWFNPDRLSMPGGELVPKYLEEVTSQLREAAALAAGNLQEVDVTYAAGHCDMAADRDYWDELAGRFVCGLNPGAPADDTVIVARVTDRTGGLKATLVNYACHPTTLAHENTEISPDFAGAMREEVTRATGAPCVFVQGASGDLAPRYDYLGGHAAADRNGRWLAYAALGILESMGPPAADYRYRGSVASGANLGIWEHIPLSPERLDQVSCFEGGTHSVDLPLKTRPDPVQLQEELERWQSLQSDAEARRDTAAAADYRARVERSRRALSRLSGLPKGKTVPYRYSVHRLGDAAVVTCAGEPYSLLQSELRRRFPGRSILVCGVSDGPSGGYLIPRDRYDRGLYQDEICLVTAGSLERVIDTIAERIDALFRIS